MKLSHFNVIIPTETPHEYLLANMMSGAVIAVDEEVNLLVEKGDLDLIDGDTLKALSAIGVVVPADLDEYQKVKVEFERKKYVVKSLSFSLVTTYSCNLACPYCYQGKGTLFHGTMTEDTRNRALAFIRDRVETNHAETLSLALFGGEPLLDFENSRLIMESCSVLAEEHDAAFFTVLITNGTLVDPSIAEDLKRYNTRHVQITLDGPREVHDRRRAYKKGGGTFDDIVKSVRILQDHELSVYFRINVDEETRPFLSALFDEIHQLGLSDVEVYCSRVTQSQAGYNYSRCIAREDFHDVLSEFQNLAREKGQPVIVHPVSPSYLSCGFLTEGACVIDPHADVYKCLTFVGQPQYSAGHIDSEGKIQYTPAYYDWMSRDPLSIPECRQCTMLPSCGGGCAAVAYETCGTFHAPGCDQPGMEIKHELLRYLERHFPEDFKKGKIIWD